MPTPPSDLDPAADDHLPPPPIPVLPLALLVWMISQAASAIAFTAVAEPGDTLTDLDGTEIFLAVLPLQVILLLGSFAIVAPHGAVMQRLRLTRWSPRELALGFLMGVGAQIVIGVVYRPILEAFDRVRWREKVGVREWLIENGTGDCPMGCTGSHNYWFRIS